MANEGAPTPKSDESEGSSLLVLFAYKVMRVTVRLCSKSDGSSLLKE